MSRALLLGHSGLIVLWLAGHLWWPWSYYLEYGHRLALFSSWCLLGLCPSRALDYLITWASEWGFLLSSFLGCSAVTSFFRWLGLAVVWQVLHTANESRLASEGSRLLQSPHVYWELPMCLVLSIVQCVGKLAVPSQLCHWPLVLSACSWAGVQTAWSSMSWCAHPTKHHSWCCVKTTGVAWWSTSAVLAAATSALR